MSSADKFCRYHNEDAVTGCPQCIAGKESAALRARIAELEAQLAAAEKVVEAAFKALSDIETQLDGNDDRLGIMATTDGYYAWHSDEDYVKAREQAAEARRLRAELEGK